MLAMMHDSQQANIKPTNISRVAEYGERFEPC